MQSAFPDEPHPDDILLCVKLHLSSPTLAQQPVVFCPARYLQDLGVHQLKLAPRIAFSDRQLHEFLRTARTIRPRPWCMAAAADFLEDMVETNQKGGSENDVPPLIQWLWKPVRVSKPSPPSSLRRGELDFASRKASYVQVQPKKTVRKRPAAAAAAAADNIAGAPDMHVEPGAPSGSGVAPSRNRRPAGPLPDPSPDRYGCSKCRHSATGCGTCRAKLGVYYDHEAGAWKRAAAQLDAAMVQNA